MNFDFSEEQELFRSSVERFAGDLDAPKRWALRKNTGGYDRGRWQIMAELGLLALAAPARFDGLDGEAIDLAVVGEALGKAIAPDPWLENGVLPVRLLALAGASKAVNGAMAGTAIYAAALAERQGRYTLAPHQTKAVASADGYVLSGEKTFVLGGALADRLIVSADLAGEVAVFLVDAAQAGVDARHYRIVDGSLASEIKFLDVALAKDQRLALGLADLEITAADVRLQAAAEMLGLAQRLFDDTLDYVKQRQQFGVPIGTFQVIQHRLVECYAKLEQARSMLYRAALTNRDNVAEWRRAAAGAKAFVGDVAGHIAREAVQLHGGMGITEELLIGHAMKRVLLLSSFLGDSDAALVDYAVAA
ncbi:acyl-CoA dehydrogenase [Novosphingobium sp.]|uniref:acyl-CoA dehydrogenase family protein n=1 Tax=Novosphingobium sp. TaxID=1874826 RepID=UPI0025E013DC|nr:acyl-CoA dehydrogenase [Novosphingobium sp.]